MKVIPLEDLNRRIPGTLMEGMGVRFTGIGEDFVEAEMPVDRRTHQPDGILHGGASVALAETLGSIGAFLSIDSDRFYCVGLEINANHIRSMKSGIAIGTARSLHLGRSTQVWEIQIRDKKDGKLVCISRLTVAVIERKPAQTL